MVHESGHALGLSGFARYLPNLRRAGHPAILNTVMNYNIDVVETSEPDCAPQPLDIMAIYALYQGVPGRP